MSDEIARIMAGMTTGDPEDLALLCAEIERLRADVARYDVAQMRGWDLVREVTAILFDVSHDVAKYEMDPSEVLPAKARELMTVVERLRRDNEHVRGMTLGLERALRAADEHIARQSDQLRVADALADVAGKSADVALDPNLDAAIFAYDRARQGWPTAGPRFARAVRVLRGAAEECRDEVAEAERGLDLRFRSKAQEAGNLDLAAECDAAADALEGKPRPVKAGDRAGDRHSRGGGNDEKR
jgi:hypothetical protein